MTAVRDDMTVRAVQYEIVPTGRAVSLGLSPDTIDRSIGRRSQVAVLWCTDEDVDGSPPWAT